MDWGWRFRRIRYARTKSRITAIATRSSSSIGYLFIASQHFVRIGSVTVVIRGPVVVVLSVIDVLSRIVVVAVRRIQHRARDLVGLQLRIGEVVNHRSHVHECTVASIVWRSDCIWWSKCTVRSVVCCGLSLRSSWLVGICCTTVAVSTGFSTSL